MNSGCFASRDKWIASRRASDMMTKSAKMRLLRSNTYRSRVTNSTDPSDFTNVSNAAYSSTISGGLFRSTSARSPVPHAWRWFFRVNRRLHFGHAHAAVIASHDRLCHRLGSLDNSLACRNMQHIGGGDIARRYACARSQPRGAAGTGAEGVSRCERATACCEARRPHCSPDIPRHRR